MINNGDCHTCLRIEQDCPRTGTGCARYYVADTGTLDVTSNGDQGETLSGSLTDVLLLESTVDLITGHSMTIQGGRTWCLAELDFTATLGAG